MLAYFSFVGWQKAKPLALELLIALPLAYVLARIAGLFYHHPQPFVVEGFEPLIPHAVDNAFPSDHMLIASVFAVVGFLSNQWFGLSLFVFAALVAIGRVAAGLHYPIDIVASGLLAILAVYIAKMATSHFFKT
jgi:undecaprenyl-diphosphatase